MRINLKIDGETYGSSPALFTINGVRKMNKIHEFVLSPDGIKLLACISYWESRIVPFPFGFFFLLHNIDCMLNAGKYRKKLTTELLKISTKKD